MEKEPGGESLEQQAKKRVEAVVQRELAGETKQLERLKASVQQELAKTGGAEGARLQDAAGRVFIGIVYDNDLWGVWI